jgi:spore coat polysaccharide biosynthesis protein SpsF
VRISGDSPFVDAETIDAMVGAPENVGADLATNIFPRSSPPGLSVEIIRTQSLAHGLAEGMTPNDREHVTPWFYRNAETLKIVNFRSPDVYPANVRLTVDTLDELIRANEIAARLARPYAAASGLEIARIAAELAATMP